jgi:hypothetical protein
VAGGQWSVVSEFIIAIQDPLTTDHCPLTTGVQCLCILRQSSIRKARFIPHARSGPIA